MASTTIMSLVNQMDNLKVVERKFHFAPKLKCRNDEVQELSIEEVVERIKKQENFFCEKMGEKYYPGGFTKFYADLDLDDYDTQEEAENEDKQALETFFTEHIQKIFLPFYKKQVSAENIYFIWRTGAPKLHKDKYKLSCHIIIDAFKIRYTQLFPFMEAMKKQYGDQCAGFYSDLSVYQNKQINCVWCRKDDKGLEKDRVFIPSVPLTVKNFLLFTLNHTEGLPEVDLSSVLAQQPKDNPARVPAHDTKEIVEEVKHIMSILPAKVANDQDKSTRVQYACKVIGKENGDPEMFLEDFVKFMQQKEDFKNMSFDETYVYIKHNWFKKLNSESRIGIGFLRKLAYSYVPDKYQSKEYIFKEHDLAAIIQHLEKVFQGQCIFCNKKWYIFDAAKQIWKQQYPLVIERYMEDTLSYKFKEQSNFIKQEICKGEQDEEQKEKFQALQKSFKKMFDLCRAPNKVKESINTLQNRFEEQDFLSKFDERPDCLNFNNGYIKFEKDTYRFYERQKSDYFLMNTGYDFEDNNNFDLVFEFLELFKESFDNQEKLDCLLDCAAYALHGLNFNEKFLSMVGLSGRNGKGLFDTLMKNTLGTYYSSISAEYFIQESSPQAANDQEKVLKHSRWITVSEPREGKKLNEAKIKKYVGGDQITARGLYEQTQWFVPQAFLVFQSNSPLLFDHHTPAIEQRKISLDFPFCFRDNVEDIRGEQDKLGNNNLKELTKNPELHKQFILFLIKRFYQKEFNNKARIFIADSVKETSAFQTTEIIEDFLEVIYKICNITGDIQDYVWHDDLKNAYCSYTSSAMDIRQFCGKLKVPNNVFIYETNRTQQKPVAGKERKGYKVRKLQLKQLINENLVGFDQFLEDTYRGKFEKFYSVVIYLLMRDYNNWLSGQEDYKQYYISCNQMRLLLQNESNTFGDWCVSKYGETRETKDMFKIQVKKNSSSKFQPGVPMEIDNEGEKQI